MLNLSDCSSCSGFYLAHIFKKWLLGSAKCSCTLGGLLNSGGSGGTGGLSWGMGLWQCCTLVYDSSTALVLQCLVFIFQYLYKITLLTALRQIRVFLSTVTVAFQRKRLLVLPCLNASFICFLCWKYMVLRTYCIFLWNWTRGGMFWQIFCSIIIQNSVSGRNI